MYTGDWLARREMLTPNKAALIDTARHDQPITYREWNRAANRTANFLRSASASARTTVSPSWR